MSTGSRSRPASAPAPQVADRHDLIRVHGARVNNLKDVSVEIPKRGLTVFTGVSGSGKSSLVFGTIAAESHAAHFVVGEPMLGVATTLSAGAGVGTHRSWSSPSTLPSGSVTVATRRPPPTSCAGSFTVAPAAVTSASFASMSGTCQ